MFEMIQGWWEEIKALEFFKSDEVSKKNFLDFLLRKKIVVDEKELDGLCKDLIGITINENGNLIKKGEFLRMFMRPMFKGALQNLHDFLDKHSMIISRLPMSVKAMYYKRQLLFAGIFSISDPSLNKQCLDGKIVLKALQEI